MPVSKEELLNKLAQIQEQAQMTLDELPMRLAKDRLRLIIGLTKYLATYDAQKALYEADPRIPAWSELAEEVSSDPVIAGFVASSQNGVPMPNIPQMGSVWDLWNAAQVQIIKGADPAGTWTKMVSDLEATIDALADRVDAQFRKWKGRLVNHKSSKTRRSSTLTGT